MFCLFFTNVIFSQDETTPFTSNDNDPDKTGETVHLYDIEVEGLKIPLEISYNHAGFKANEASGIVGLGWKFHDIGKITRKVNHLPDDYQVSYNPTPDKGGWFFNDNSYISELGTNTTNSETIREASDLSPDFYNFNSSFGKSALFTFDKTITAGNIGLSPLFLDTNDNFTLDFNLNNLHYGLANYQDVVFDLHEENGFTYSFVGGPNNAANFTYYQEPKSIKDYYISKIKSDHSTDEILITYEEKIYLAKQHFETAFKGVNNSYYIRNNADNTYHTESELVPYLILTPREKISFEYKTYQAPSLNIDGLSTQYLPLLESIYITNLNDEIITSFHFVYSEWIGDRRPLLTKIYKGEKGFYYGDYYAQSFYVEDPSINIHKIKEFEYYDYFMLEFGSNNTFINGTEIIDIDGFGYYNDNGSSSNSGLLPGYYQICNAPGVHFNNRLPNLEAIKQGVLKKSINNLGGSREYDYQLNSDSAIGSGGLYGGGLKIASIIEKPDMNTTYTTTFEYSGLSGFTISLTNPESSMSGSMGSMYYRRSYVDLEFQDYCQECEGVNHYQTSGNFFETVISKKFVKIDFLDILQQGDFIEAELFSKTKTTYRPNYKTLVRTPLVKKVEVFNEFVFDQMSSYEYLISKKEYTYDFVNYSEMINANRVYSYGITNCQGEYFYGAPSTIRIFNRPIYKIEMPLKEIKYEKSITEDSGYSQTITSRQEFSYFGENDPNYELNILRPKEIINYQSGIPVSKKKYKYMVEEFIPGAGLTNLTDFSTEDKTLLSNESNWTYEDGTWILNSANFYEYLADGKLSYTSSAIKASDNTFYTESNFNPYYSGGVLTGVSLLNKVGYSYDANGKIDIIKDYENDTFKKFYRDNNLSGIINTVLEGYGNTSTPYVYRNSFENSNGVDYVETSNAFTGEKVYAGTTSLNLGSYPIKYIVSYWYYQNNQWEFNSYTHTGGDVIISKPPGADYIDEVWIRPRYTKLSGKVYNKYGETTNWIDDKGFMIKNIYDDFGRLIKQVDRDGNIENERTYNFTEE